MKIYPESPNAVIPFSRSLVNTEFVLTNRIFPIFTIGRIVAFAPIKQDHNNSTIPNKKRLNLPPINLQPTF